MGGMEQLEDSLHVNHGGFDVLSKLRLTRQRHEFWDISFPKPASTRLPGCLPSNDPHILLMSRRSYTPVVYSGVSPQSLQLTSLLMWPCPHKFNARS